MDHFQYTLKLKEMPTLKTKKAKQAFIKEVTSGLDWYGARGTVLDIKLSLDIYHFFKDEGLTGTASIPKLVNYSITTMCPSQIEIEKLLEFIPKTTQYTASNDYRAFMNSSGIPAYLKLLVLKAQNEYP